MKTLNIKRLIGTGAVALLLVMSGSALAGVKAKSGAVGKSGNVWTAVCHQMTSPGKSKGNPKILYVPSVAADSDSSDHKGSGKPGNPGGGHDDILAYWDADAEGYTCDEPDDDGDGEEIP